MSVKNEIVSVIIPVYNVADYIYRCLWSVTNQTYTNLEIIVVDDGSTDSSGEICDEFAKNDDRIKVIHKKNGGLSDARNVGIENCRGEFVSLIDGDDIICQSFIQILYETIIKTGADMACTEMLCFYDAEENRLLDYWNDNKVDNYVSNIFFGEELIEMSLYHQRSVVGAPQKLYRKKMFDKVRFPVGKYYEDFVTTYLFFEEANRVAIIDKKLYGYRMRNNSIMNQPFNERKMDCIWAIKFIEDYFKSRKVQGIQCASFRLCRQIYYQIPFRDKKNRNLVWNEIKKTRKKVLSDKRVKGYERILALLSYTGKTLFVFWTYCFVNLRKIAYRKGIN